MSDDLPTPRIDSGPAKGPGGPDAVEDWEGADENAVVPDPPRSAQIRGEEVPDELDEPEELDESDGAGSHPEDAQEDGPADGSGEDEQSDDAADEDEQDATEKPDEDSPA